MQELQRTLAELKREEREMAAERLSGRTTGQQHEAASSQYLPSNLQTDGAQAGSSQINQQVQKWLSYEHCLERCTCVHVNSVNCYCISSKASSLVMNVSYAFNILILFPL